jgi:hypothetical protein
MGEVDTDCVMRRSRVCANKRLMARTVAERNYRGYDVRGLNKKERHTKRFRVTMFRVITKHSINRINNLVYNIFTEILEKKR